MASEWRKQRFGQMAVLVRETVKPSDAQDLPYIGLEHIGQGTLQLLSVGSPEDATSLKVRFNAGDILFGKLRPYFRKVVRPAFDGICSTDIWVVRPLPGVYAQYLFYLMASDLLLEPIIRASEGTKMPRARWDYAASLELPLPPLPEQRAIAHILGTLDDKIELNRRMSETLEAMARALFKAWFVDFEPVRAKMEGCWQRGESLPGLPSHLYDLFPNRLVNSELGEVPEGWKVARLEQIMTFQKGRKPHASFHRAQEGCLPVILIESFEGAYSSYALPDGAVVASEEDVLMVMDGASSGRVETGCRGIVGSTIAKVVLKPGLKVGRRFLYYCLKSLEHEIRNHHTGTSIPHTDKSWVLSQMICLPSEFQLLRVLEDALGAAQERIQALRIESRTLAALRDALLPKLIRGEIRVKDAERFLKERGL